MPSAAVAGRHTGAAAVPAFEVGLTFELGQLGEAEAFSIRGRRESGARRLSGERDEDEDEEGEEEAAETDRLLTREKAQ